MGGAFFRSQESSMTLAKEEAYTEGQEDGLIDYDRGSMCSTHTLGRRPSENEAATSGSVVLPR